MDWRVYHAINVWVSHHEWVGRVFRYVESDGTALIAVAAVALWLAARPGADRKWKLVAASALASGALGYVVNQVIHALWDRPRPYEAHAGVFHPYSSSTDAGFPSDHSSAAFGIAFAVLLLDRVVGSLFLVAAVLIGVGRVVVGAHYPFDVIAGLAVGLGSAIVVVRLGRPALAFLVRLVERATDPLLRPLWTYFSTGSSR